jgi:RNA polymerase sigma-70 factor (ECF subfamily)
VSSFVQDDSIDLLGRMAREERSSLVAVARGEGLTPEEALECVQDVLCALLRVEGAPSPSPDQALASAKARVRNAARNFRRLHRRAIPHDAFDGDREPVGETPHAEELVLRAEDLLRLRTCVAELCEIERAVVTLRLLDERSGEDVAATLGLARGYVDVLVHRAKAALRACMTAG